MHLSSLSLIDFRNFAELSVTFDPAGTTVITGSNGAGKTNLLEAVGYLTGLRSFRHVPREAMVRHGASTAVLRAGAEARDRSLTLEAEIATAGKSRMFVNRQFVRRRADLHEGLRSSVFSPEDIAVVRGGPGDRRDFLDDVLSVVDAKVARAVEETERILRQRNALLRDAARRSTAEVEDSLDVWDEQLDEAGTRLAEAREDLLGQLRPWVQLHYERLAGRPTAVETRYQRSWSDRLASSLDEHRRIDLARGVTSVGPHRDDVELTISGLPARTQASQGEQRSLALALRLAAHQLATERLREPPVLLLDDVFSELDSGRRRALMEGLPVGQALLTTATTPPAEVTVAGVLEIRPPEGLPGGEGPR